MKKALTRPSPRGWVDIPRQSWGHIYSMSRSNFKRLYARGADPCKYCGLGVHRACGGAGCSCGCPRAVELRAAGVKIDGRKKYELGTLACKGCVQGDHRRCTKLCSCDCRARRVSQH